MANDVLLAWPHTYYFFISDLETLKFCSTSRVVEGKNEGQKASWLWLVRISKHGMWGKAMRWHKFCMRFSDARIVGILGIGMF